MATVIDNNNVSIGENVNALASSMSCARITVPNDNGNCDTSVSTSTESMMTEGDEAPTAPKSTSTIDEAIKSAAKVTVARQKSKNSSSKHTTRVQSRESKQAEQYKFVKLWTDMMDGIIASLDVNVDYIKVKDGKKNKKQRVVTISGNDLVEWLSIYIDVHFPAKLKDNSEIPLRVRARKLSNMLLSKKIIVPVDKRLGKWSSMVNIDGEWISNEFKDREVYEFQGEYLTRLDNRIEATKMEQSLFKGNGFKAFLSGKAKAQTELSPDELEARKHEMKTTVHTNYVGHEVTGGAELQDLIMAEFRLPSFGSSSRRSNRSTRDSSRGSSSRKSDRDSKRKSSRGESTASLVSLAQSTTKIAA